MGGNAMSPSKDPYLETYTLLLHLLSFDATLLEKMTVVTHVYKEFRKAKFLYNVVLTL